jgi:hypothetical protein
VGDGACREVRVVLMLPTVRTPPGWRFARSDHPDQPGG